MDISRRGFLSGLLATVVAEAIPYNRVWFIPKTIKIIPTLEEYADFVTASNLLFPSELSLLTTIYYEKSAVENLKRQTSLDAFFKDRRLPKSLGDKIQLYQYRSPFESVENTPARDFSSFD